MLRIRRLEERSAELYGQGKIRGFLHLYVGEEAVAVGAMQALGPEDVVVATYREHGQALARGMDPGAVMAEMYGKVTGCSKGRGGSMHLFSHALRFYGGSGIVAGGLPLAVGLALAAKMLGERRVTACFFGDGATDEGEFHESLNLAALWALPVLFLCENNRYAMGTALHRHAANPDLRQLPAAYGVVAEKVDGMDVLAVERAVRHAAEEVREQGTPRFLELETYRFRAHSMFDAELYRDEAEVRAEQARDPITLFSERLRAQGLLDDDALAAIEREVEEELARAVAFAEQSPWEPVEELATDVVTREVGR
ncbi:MAG: pyruvate dehydrogenase (acetyl-transferring) E1 component subunit alpha [Sandaracinaceae bacterium]|nr:pyruvate dehydrogenase (acetyl-transferring) E1 component subunit alpha [Sandaracinaceae bacterium]